MSARARVLPKGLGLALAGWLAATPALAQQVTAQGPLGQVDSWGEGFLSKADGPLPPAIWSNTDGATLKPLFEMKATQLSPALRHALKRVIGSVSKPPKDGDDLVVDRLRLMAEIGESSAAIAIRRKYPDADWGKSGDAQLSEMELASGRAQTACARTEGKRADDPDWLQVRLLCFVNAGDVDAAAMVGEQAMTGEEAADPWVVAALETLRGPTKSKPAGRYGTAFEAALSVAAKLSAGPDAFRSTPPDLAEAVLKHPGATPDQRRAALRSAVEAGDLAASEVIRQLTMPAEPVGPAPQGQTQLQAQSKAQRAIASSKGDFLGLALDAMANPDLAPPAKATAYVAALKSAETAQEFRVAAVALSDELKSLPRTDATQPYAETFARAALAAGNVDLAKDWRELIDKGAKDKTAIDAWAAARIDLLLSFAAADRAKSGALLDRLLAALPAAPELNAKAATPVDRQAELRRIETTRILFFYVGTGRPLTPAARAELATQRTAGRGVSDAALARIQAALAADADGEALMAAIALFGSDPSAMSFAGLADLLTFMAAAGLGKEVDAVALEAMQPWKAL